MSDQLDFEKAKAMDYFSHYEEAQEEIKKLREERCFICRPDDPLASEEGCKDCDEKSDLNQEILRLQCENAELRAEISTDEIHNGNDLAEIEKLKESIYWMSSGLARKEIFKLKAQLKEKEEYWKTECVKQITKITNENHKIKKEKI